MAGIAAGNGTGRQDASRDRPWREPDGHPGVPLSSPTLRVRPGRAPARSPLDLDHGRWLGTRLRTARQPRLRGRQSEPRRRRPLRPLATARLPRWTPPSRISGQRASRPSIASGNDGFVDAISFPACISTAPSAWGPPRTARARAAAPRIRSPCSRTPPPFLSLLAPGQWINSSVPGGGFAELPRHVDGRASRGRRLGRDETGESGRIGRRDPGGAPEHRQADPGRLRHGVADRLHRPPVQRERLQRGRDGGHGHHHRDAVRRHVRRSDRRLRDERR